MAHKGVVEAPQVSQIKGICHMTNNPVVACRAPDGFSAAPLTDLLRQRALQLIAQSGRHAIVAAQLSH